MKRLLRVGLIIFRWIRGLKTCRVCGSIVIRGVCWKCLKQELEIVRANAEQLRRKVAQLGRSNHILYKQATGKPAHVTRRKRSKGKA